MNRVLRPAADELVLRPLVAQMPPIEIGAPFGRKKKRSFLCKVRGRAVEIPVPLADPVNDRGGVGARFPPNVGSVFPQMCVSSCIALFLACIVSRPSSILFAHVSCVYFMYFAGFEDVCRPRPTIHVFDTRFKSSLSIHHDTCKYMHPKLDLFDTCTIHVNTSAFRARKI